MFKWLFKKKSIESVIHARRKVTIDGLDFIIKKIDIIDYLHGAKVLQQTYDIYRAKLPEKANDDGIPDAAQIKKIKEHYRDVICSGVVSPEIGRKPGQGVIQVDDLLINWDLSTRLYQAILDFSYPKKKL